MSFYDTNTNTDSQLTEIETILEDMEVRNGIIVGGDFNTITNPTLEQKGHQECIAEHRQQGN